MTKEIAVKAGPEALVEFKVLGALQMTVGGQPWELGAEQEQRLLVALLDARGAQVPHGRLMEAVWDDQHAAKDDLYKLAYTLRKRFAAVGRPSVLTGRSGTYQLAIPPGCVDVHRFHERVEQARVAVGRDDAQAAALMEDALRLHQGEPLAGMRGRWVDNYRHGLVEERRAVELRLYEAAIRDGQSRERLPGLQALFRERPQDEGVAWLLMHALYRAGRQPDALAVRHDVDGHLVDTIGAESLRPLRELYDRILRQDTGLLQPEALSYPGHSAGARVRAPDRPGWQVFHDDRDQGEEKVMNAAPDDGFQDHDEQPDGPAANPEPAASPRCQPGTSIVINGAVHAPGGVIGTQNNHYGQSW